MDASTDTNADAAAFNASAVNLDEADPRDIICYLNSGGNEYDGRLGARIAALFVILIVSTAVTFFPVVAKRVRRLRIPLYVYLFARYFGAGVIVATAFIHLLDPAYDEIGPASCVGMTGGWANYAWCPAIVLVSVMFIFIMDFSADRYVELKYGPRSGPDEEEVITGHSANNRALNADKEAMALEAYKNKFSSEDMDGAVEEWSPAQEQSYKQQIAAFYILEFGVIFHSIVIGLNLGVVGEEFKTLFVVLVFHQSFEGLGIGARMSAIPFPPKSWLPWILCLAYGLTTPIAIAIGLGVRTTYNPESFTANVVSGVLDSLSAGILIYTGLVELLARDFLFNPVRTQDSGRLTFMMVCVVLGVGLMALLGKWA